MPRRSSRYETPDRIINRSPFFRLLAPVVFWLTLGLVVIADKMLFRLRVVGRENLRLLPRGRGCFLVSNHTLYLDPALVAHAVAPRRTAFTVYQETFDMPFVGNYIRLLGAFPLREHDPLRKIIPVVRETLRKGWFVPFPRAT